MVKLQLSQMIVDAILTQKERGGSSRKSIWKYLQDNYSDHVSKYNNFATQLKRLAAAGTQVIPNPKNAARFQLNSSFRGKVARMLANGEPIHLAQKHAMTTKVKGSKKKPKTRKKAKANKTKKGKSKAAKKSKSKAIYDKLINDYY